MLVAPAAYCGLMLLDDGNDKNFVAPFSTPATGNHTPVGLVHPAAAIFLLDLTSSAHNYGSVRNGGE